MRRSLRWSAVVFVVLLNGALLGSAVASGSLAGRPPIETALGTPASLTFSVGGAYAFAPNEAEVAPGANVTVTVDLSGSYQHTFTLSPISNFTFNASDSAGHLMTFFALHHPLINLSITNSVTTGNFTAPTEIGVYQFVCLAAGHFQSGMWGLLGVGMAPPSIGTTSLGPGAPVYIIVGTISGLVILALVLGFVFGRREGARHEMPPERLGYAEPKMPSGPGPHP